MYEELILYGSIAVIVISLIWSELGIRIKSFAVCIEKYPTGLFLKVHEDADAIQTKLHGTKATFIKQFEPLVVKRGRRMMRLFLVKPKTNETLRWSKGHKKKEIKGKVSEWDATAGKKTKMDAVETQKYGNKQFFEGLRAGVVATRQFLMGLVCGGLGGTGIVMLILVGAKVL